VFIVTAGVRTAPKFVTICAVACTDYSPGFGPRNHRVVCPFYSRRLCRSCILRPPSWPNLSRCSSHLPTSHPQEDANFFFVSYRIYWNLWWRHRSVHDRNDRSESRNLRLTSNLYRIVRHDGSYLVDFAGTGKKIRVNGTKCFATILKSILLKSCSEVEGDREIY
jgi:hypothetical protein